MSTTQGRIDATHPDDDWSTVDRWKDAIEAMPLPELLAYEPGVGSVTATDGPHWFADIDSEAKPPYRWQPCLETQTGHIPCFDVWFDSKEACEDWIREFVRGAPLDDA